MEKTISFMNGEESIGHNTRRYVAGNMNADRIPRNIPLSKRILSMLIIGYYISSFSRNFL